MLDTNALNIISLMNVCSYIKSCTLKVSLMDTFIYYSIFKLKYITFTALHKTNILLNSIFLFNVQKDFKVIHQTTHQCLFHWFMKNGWFLLKIRLLSKPENNVFFVATNSCAKEFQMWPLLKSGFHYKFFR